MERQRLYPSDVQTFEKMRLGGYVYVDKTGYVYRMTHSGSTCVFSGLNNIGNICKDEEYAAICWITREELSGQMAEDIEILGKTKDFI